MASIRSGSFRYAKAVVVAVIVVAALAGCGIEEPEFWNVGFLNDSDADYILTDGGGGPYVMPAHSTSRLQTTRYPDQTAQAVVFDTSCRTVGSVTTKLHLSLVYIDPAGNISATSGDIVETASPSPAFIGYTDAFLDPGGGCRPGWWHIDARNDSDSAYYLAVVGGSRPVYVPAHTRGNLAGSDAGNVPDRVTLYDAHCVQLATARVPGDGAVIYIDASGQMTAQPQAALWAPSPPAAFRGYWNHTDTPTFCPSVAPGASRLGRPGRVTTMPSNAGATQTKARLDAHALSQAGG